MKLSYVIVTHNRRDALMATLRHLHHTTPLPPHRWETWVVDNASTDGTLDAVRRSFGRVNTIARPDNEGVGARSHAFSKARGEYLILLDDDSYPVGDAVTRSLQYLDEHDDVAAVVGKVVLPDGSDEGCALPSVMLSGAVCLRKRVMEAVGGFRPEFFRKAGEYDVSFRIWQAGYRVERFEDVVYRHDKVMTGRSSSLAHFMDLRNNLILVERYFPRDLRTIYRRDWLRRYVAIARAAGEMDAAREAVADARRWAARERLTGRQTLAPGALETILEWDRQAQLVADWARATGARRVVIADYGKNLYATCRAAQLGGLDVLAIADAGRAFAGLRYRRVPIVPLADAAALEPDGVIISNINPAQTRPWIDRVKQAFAGPVLSLWAPQYIEPRSSEHLIGAES